MQDWGEAVRTGAGSSSWNDCWKFDGGEGNGERLGGEGGAGGPDRRGKPLLKRGDCINAGILSWICLASTSPLSPIKRARESRMSVEHRILYRELGEVE